MTNPPLESSEVHALPRWLRSWERFWFTPADPSILALIRVACGLIVLYTLFAYSFQLQDDMGEYAWHDLLLRMDLVRDKPVRITSLTGRATPPLPPPANEFQASYARSYRQKWGVFPPPPYPNSTEQINYLDMFRERYGVDLRANGLRPPATAEERAYVERYVTLWKVPPPQYARDPAEAQMVEEYRLREGEDPRQLYDRGWYAFSLWFHVTDPTAMAILHGLIVFTALLFTIGLGTRITAALTWFGTLSYIHRSPPLLYGADTMMNILLLYLMLSPCGAVFSLDQGLRRWWNNRQGMPPRDTSPQGVLPPPEPSVSANLALRLMQVHLCIIYLAAGLSKLLGPAWWSGTAVWGTIGCYEFAPMQNELYLSFLRFLGSNQLYFSLFVTGGGLFTLAFEISYTFLIWRPRLRWFFLGSAFLLHGFIGLLMGLTTFTWLMVVMNMAFLRKEEAHWILSWFHGPSRSPAAEKTLPLPPNPSPKLEPVSNPSIVKKKRSE